MWQTGKATVDDHFRSPTVGDNQKLSFFFKGKIEFFLLKKLDILGIAFETCI
jgi:hypothetical protein